MKLHSFTDIITNSSSEMFVIKKNKSKNTIRKLFTDLLLYYKESAIDEVIEFLENQTTESLQVLFDMLCCQDIEDIDKELKNINFEKEFEELNEEELKLLQNYIDKHIIILDEHSNLYLYLEKYNLYDWLRNHPDMIKRYYDG